MQRKERRMGESLTKEELYNDVTKAFDLKGVPVFYRGRVDRKIAEVISYLYKKYILIKR